MHGKGGKSSTGHCEKSCGKRGPQTHQCHSQRARRCQAYAEDVHIPRCPRWAEDEEDVEQYRWRDAEKRKWSAQHAEKLDKRVHRVCRAITRRQPARPSVGPQISEAVGKVEPGSPINRPQIGAVDPQREQEERKARDNARRQVVAPTFKKRIFPRGLFINNVSATVRSADARSIEASSEQRA